MPDLPHLSYPKGDRSEWADEAPWKTLTREEAKVLAAKNPQLSPWRVVAAQAAVGVGVAVLAGAITGTFGAAWSALYGAAAVVIPAALMARGMTSRLSSLSPAVSFVSVMVWESVKVIVTVAMLAAAPRIVQPLNWPALLVALVACTCGYGFALLWRGRTR
ncbi:MAG: ATP synthase subunit I [Burkholderiaceae bacterium]